MKTNSIQCVLESLIVVRGGGDIATGAVQKLHRAGFPVLVLETDKPTAIRRTVALSECMYEGTARVEDMRSKKINDPREIEKAILEGFIPFLEDPKGNCLPALAPICVVDAIIAKKNLGTNKQMAPITIGLGPGFTAPDEVDCVIETMRGHHLGRLIFEGEAQKNTGVPGNIGGFTTERVLYSPGDGRIRLNAGKFSPEEMLRIGNFVEKGQELGSVGQEIIRAEISGVLRGIIRDGFPVYKGMKIGDIDPRGTEEHCFTISDKARCIGGAVLEAVMLLIRKKDVKS